MSNRTCSVEGCANSFWARGFCGTHYQKFRKSPDFTIHKRGICSIRECGNTAKGHGWCNTHYQRWKRNGDPLLGNTQYRTLEEAFLAQYERDGDCLVWTGAKDEDGYGSISAKGMTKSAHRYAWERRHGDIKNGMEINHICWNRSCVNIDHLELSDRYRNTAYRSGANKGSASGIRNVYKHGSKWQVKVMRYGKFYHYGTFADIDEAAKAAESARQEVLGKHAGRG